MLKLAISLLLVLLVLSLVLIPPATMAKSKAEKAITKAIGRAVEGNWKSIDMVNISRFRDNSTMTVWNKTVTVNPVPPPSPGCLPNPDQYIDKNGNCVPNPSPPPSTGNISKLCLVGDLQGNTVPNMMKADGCNEKIGLGDLGYQNDLSYYKGLKFDHCVIGNHDTPEDGNSAIYKEALAYCGDAWYIKTGKAALIFGFNTNGNLDNQLNGASKILLDNQAMQGIKTIVLLTHKPCYTNPNAHHPVESKIKAFCDKLSANIPTNLKVIYAAAHNHVMSSSADNTKFTSGAGGRSHYSCGTDAIWTFCDNKNFGYLELTIDNNNGNTAAKFIK